MVDTPPMVEMARAVLLIAEGSSGLTPEDESDCQDFREALRTLEETIAPGRLRLVIVESPYGSIEPAVVEANVKYARACLRDCLKRGEAPYASHLLYTQPGVLDDNDPEERKLGIEAGLEWGKLAATVVYTDRGVSSGMEQGVARAHQQGRVVEFRKLGR